MMSNQQRQPGIDVAELERELSALWINLGEGDPESTVTRSCVLNLLVYTPASEADYRLDETLIEVTGKHPGRAILLLADRDATEPLLDAWVSSRCALPTSNSKQVCCEQITIRASATKVRETPSAVVSLILADLPVYLWWRDVPRLGDAFFRRCASVADRVLVDTGAASSTLEGLGEIAHFLSDGGRRTPLVDLNWTRLLTWRSVLAGFYDVPDYRKALNRIEKVEICYNPTGAPPAGTRGIAPRALYLSAWLASRLGWKFDRAGTTAQANSFGFTFTAEGREVRVLLNELEGPAERGGRLDQVVLSCSVADSGRSTFSLTKTADDLRLAAQVTLADARRLERVLGYDRWTESTLLVKELEALGHDRVFEESALLAEQMIRALDEGA